eukprot:1786422-Rhodomonas_salina.1
MRAVRFRLVGARADGGAGAGWRQPRKRWLPCASASSPPLPPPPPPRPAAALPQVRCPARCDGPAA